MQIESPTLNTFIKEEKKCPYKLLYFAISLYSQLSLRRTLPGPAPTVRLGVRLIESLDAVKWLKHSAQGPTPGVRFIEVFVLEVSVKRELTVYK